MRTYKYQQGTGELTITIDDKAGTIVSLNSSVEDITLPDGSMSEMLAAVAMAVYETINNEVHDDESDVITLDIKPTQWNERASVFNSLNK